MQHHTTSRGQRIRDFFTSDITLKRIWRWIKGEDARSEFRRWKDAAERPGRANGSGITEVSGLFAVGKGTLKEVKVHADKARAKAEGYRMTGDRSRADDNDMVAAERYIQSGKLLLAEKVGREFQGRGDYLAAARVFTLAKLEMPFFQLIESLAHGGEYDKASDVLRNFTGLRGVVKYNEIYKVWTPDMLSRMLVKFTDGEIAGYCAEMAAEGKRNHLIQLGNLTNRAGRFAAAAEIYGMLGQEKRAVACRAEHLAQSGDLVGAVELYLKAGMRFEIYQLAGRIEGDRPADAAALYEMAGDEGRSRKLLGKGGAGDEAVYSIKN